MRRVLGNEQFYFRINPVDIAAGTKRRDEAVDKANRVEKQDAKLFSQIFNEQLRKGV